MKVSLGKYPRSAKKERKISVKIDPWDTWNMDHTLALIIHPMLLQLKKTKHGSPYTDDEDIPADLNLDQEKHFAERWEWVLDEMIWAFSQIIDDDAESQFHSGNHDMIWEDEEFEGIKIKKLSKGPKDTYKFDKEGWEKWHERKRNGLKLFGKYFENLWD